MQVERDLLYALIVFIFLFKLYTNNYDATKNKRRNNVHENYAIDFGSLIR